MMIYFILIIHIDYICLVLVVNLLGIILSVVWIWIVNVLVIVLILICIMICIMILIFNIFALVILALVICLLSTQSSPYYLFLALGRSLIN